jgi:hypothetical protein
MVTLVIKATTRPCMCRSGRVTLGPFTHREERKQQSNLDDAAIGVRVDALRAEVVDSRNGLVPHQTQHAT